MVANFHVLMYALIMTCNNNKVNSNNITVVFIYQDIYNNSFDWLFIRCEKVRVGGGINPYGPGFMVACGITQS